LPRGSSKANNKHKHQVKKSLSVAYMGPCLRIMSYRARVDLMWATVTEYQVSQKR